MHRWMSPMMGAGALVVSLLATATARAQAVQVVEPIYVTVDGGVTGAVSDPIERLFTAGADGGAGLYFSLLPELAIGAHVLGGALGSGATVDGVDRGLGDYGLLAASVRVYPFASLTRAPRRAAGLYVGGSPGVGLFDGEIVPGYTLFLGLNFVAGPVSLGPRARFTHFIETQGRFDGNSVFLMTGGVEVTFFDGVQRVEPQPARVGPPLPVVAEEMERQPAPAVNDALTLDERVYFDYDEADLREAATDELDAVVAHYREHESQYARLIVSGHADDHGSPEYDRVLSAARALAVANYLVARGVPVELLQLYAYGDSALLVPDAVTEPEHQLNRRVQFDVEWKEGGRPVGMAPEPAPNAPARVDAEADAGPGPGLSHARALLDRESEELRGLVDTPLRVELREAPEAPEARVVEIEVGEGAVAER